MKKFILCFLLLGSTNLMADGKIFPASMCEAVNASDKLSLNRNEGRLKNTGTKTVEIVCPIVKDDTTEQTINELYAVGNYSSNGSCRGETLNTGGYRQIGPNYTLYSGTTFYHRVAYNLDSNDNNATYYMMCSLPANSTLSFYHFVE